MIIVTGASGQLGRLVIDALLQKRPASDIGALVRNPDKVKDLAARGVQIRQADYDQPDSLVAALQGADQVLLISANEVGRRVPQHRAVIQAAKQVGVKLLAYTSLLRADTSPLLLAKEHKETEQLIQASGIPAVILRNGWYTENFLGNIAGTLQAGAILGSFGAQPVTSASRADYAQAAAEVLTQPDQAGRIYELAGDEAYTLADLAQELTRQSGKAVAYQDLPPADYAAALVQFGLPEGFAAILADSSAGASQGWLFDASHQLSQLIQRPSTSLATAIKAALA